MCRNSRVREQLYEQQLALTLDECVAGRIATTTAANASFECSYYLMNGRFTYSSHDWHVGALLILVSQPEYRGGSRTYHLRRSVIARRSARRNLILSTAFEFDIFVKRCDGIRKCVLLEARELSVIFFSFLNYFYFGYFSPPSTHLVFMYFVFVLFGFLIFSNSSLIAYESTQIVS